MNYIRDLLKERRMTQEHLAELLDISVVRVRQILSPTASPNVATMQRIADAIGVPLWRLFATPDDVTDYVNGIEHPEEAEAPGNVPRCPYCRRPLDIHVAKY